MELQHPERIFAPFRSTNVSFSILFVILSFSHFSLIGLNAVYLEVPKKEQGREMLR